MEEATRHSAHEILHAFWVPFGDKVRSDCPVACDAIGTLMEAKQLTYFRFHLRDGGLSATTGCNTQGQQLIHSGKEEGYLIGLRFRTNS